MCSSGGATPNKILYLCHGRKMCVIAETQESHSCEWTPSNQSGDVRQTPSEQMKQPLLTGAAQLCPVHQFLIISTTESNLKPELLPRCSVTSHPVSCQDAAATGDYLIKMSNSTWQRDSPIKSGLEDTQRPAGGNGVKRENGL